MWRDYVFQEMPKAPWNAWIQTSVPFPLFALMGLTKSAKKFYSDGFRWIYDHILKKPESFIRGFLEMWKELKAARSLQNGNGLTLDNV